MDDWGPLIVLYFFVAIIVMMVMAIARKRGMGKALLLITCFSAFAIAGLMGEAAAEDLDYSQERAATYVAVAATALTVLAIIYYGWRRNPKRLLWSFGAILIVGGVMVRNSCGESVVAISIAFSIALLLATLSGATATGRDDRTRWLFQRYPRRRIADWRDGELAVAVGRVQCDAPTLAALSRRPCVCAEYVVETSADSSFWSERERQTFAADFTLTDASGEALVQVAGAELLLMKDFTVDWRDGSYQMRRREGIVQVGELVAVFGRGNREPDPRPEKMAGYRDRPTILVIRGSRREQLRVSDSPAATGRS